MPHYVFEKIKDLTKNVEGKIKVCILGITYKPNVDDMRESPVIELIHLLNEQGGFETVVVDNHVNFEGSKERDVYTAAKDAHLLVLAVNHNEFKELDIPRLKNIMKCPVVFDTRNYWAADAFEKNGMEYHLLGWGRNKS